MSNLDKVMSKLNSQKSVKTTDEVPEIEEPKKVKKLPEVPIVEEEEEPDIEEEDDEDENGEVPEPVKEVKEIPKEDISKIQQQRAEEIQILQNNGIFRVETLYQLTQINENLKDLNTLIAGVINGK
ncbi:MAG TPA: hypothetical protein VMZ91_14200 [Candidatus Paceibacterota bacterium]|nr:hypothetical protein [Candidatus Paceibacterota bacterium]